MFESLSAILLSNSSTDEQTTATNAMLRDYFLELIAAKETAPGNDLLSRLLADQVQPGNLSVEELADIAKTVLIAGHDTTSNQIALGMLALLEHPDQLRRLRDAEDSSVAKNAVEELMRYLTITHVGRMRVAMSDVEVGRVVIHAGEGVIVLADAQDRDSREFDDPNQLNIERPNADRHVGFGQGVHRCLGEPLAEMELEIAYPAVLRRLPGLHLAVPFEELKFRHQSVNFGVVSLPVAW
jgi:hypothetical protein